MPNICKICNIAFNKQDCISCEPLAVGSLHTHMGTLKAQDLNYYMKYRNKFRNSNKRKFYKQAFEEIDSEIAAEGGTDGNLEDVSSVGQKRAHSLEGGEGGKRIKQMTYKKHGAESKYGESSTNLLAKSMKSKFIEVADLKNIMTYVNHVQKFESLYKDKPVEKRSEDEELLLVKLPSGKCVGLKCKIIVPANCKTEFEMAQHEAKQIEETLQLKAELEHGDTDPEDKLDLLETELNITEKGVELELKKKILEVEQAKLNWYLIESLLLSAESSIKTSLKMDSADTDKALQGLKDILSLKIRPLMLKKHPHIVDMIKRLRQYLGNAHEWNFSDKEKGKFSLKAEKIRRTAERVSVKFKTICKIDKEVDMWDGFNELLEEFKKQIQRLTDEQVLNLCYEPNSRKAFLYQFDDTIPIAEEHLKFETVMVN